MSTHVVDDDIVCPECGGDGADAEDSTKDCWRCGGWGNVPAFTPREDDEIQMNWSTTMTKEIDSIRANVITRHMNAMLEELNESDIEVLGIAGGIILNQAGPLGTGSGCHVFCMIHSAVVPESRTTFSEDEFIADVAKTMLREAAS